MAVSWKHSLDGQVALVTGAGRGIGRAIAEELAGRGAHVACCARTQRQLDETVESIRGLGGLASSHVLDVRSEDDIAAVVGRIVDDTGGLDILVNNAGTNRLERIERLDLGAWNDVLATNLSGPFLLARTALPHLAERSGAIVNVSSVGGRPGVEKFEGMAAYVASKYGLLGFTEVLALEARRKDVRVYAVCPGSVATQMLAETIPDVAEVLHPEDVARAVAWLVTGSPLVASGTVVDLSPARGKRRG
ncbi:MAG: SDR family oxidoreductase [bacterium]